MFICDQIAHKIKSLRVLLRQCQIEKQHVSSEEKDIENDKKHYTVDDPKKTKTTKNNRRRKDRVGDKHALPASRDQL
jgi:hypothetical protein